MRASRIAAITVMGAAAFGVSAATAATASANDGRAGRIEVGPHAVKPGHVVRLSTEACHQCGPVKVHVDIDGKRHWVKLDKWTHEGKTGWFRVPRDTDPGRVEVEGHCKTGRSIEGAFWVKEAHDEHHHKTHHHHHCRHHGGKAGHEGHASHERKAGHEGHASHH